MGQARIRGSREQRVAQSQAADAALTDEERERAAWRRLPESVRRRKRKAMSFAFALKTIGEILAQPARPAKP